jgi:hypothetical protein
MWSIVVLAIMAALTGFYLLPVERGILATEDLKARELAGNMGVYRDAVATYFKDNNLTNTSVSITTLVSTGALRPYYTQSESALSIWANYRDAAGTIYIYPATLPSTNFASEIQRLSQNALSFGIYRSSDNSLYSPVDGVRVTQDASLAGKLIPNGAPIWLAWPK